GPNLAGDEPTRTLGADVPRAGMSGAGVSGGTSGGGLSGADIPTTGASGAARNQPSGRRRMAAGVAAIALAAGLIGGGAGAAGAYIAMSRGDDPAAVAPDRQADDRGGSGSSDATSVT